jgi:hypothetical protein
MDSFNRAARLLASVAILALAACSGGGGGAPNTGANNAGGNPSTGNASNNTPGNGGNTTPITPTVSIGAPDNANVAIGSGTFDFVTNLPPVGMVFGLLGPAVKVTSTTVEAANKGTNGTLTYRGMSNGVPIFDINIPAINLTATNVRADASLTPASTGSVLLGIKVLKYSAVGAWGYAPGGGITYAGVAATGSGTPIASVPTFGTGTYSGATVGIYFVPSGTGTISTGALNGDIAVTVNFGTGAVSGSLSSMTATPSDSGATAWNTVSLSASINRLTNNASFIGTTSTNGPATGSGNAGFSSAATGGLGGAFFGPNADEASGTWTLTDPTAAGGGKTAFGAFGASSTGCSGCSTGGGGNVTPPGPGVSIAVPGIGLSTFSGAAVGSSFTANPPPLGTTIPLGGGTAALTPTSVANFNAGQVSAIYRGTVTNGGITYPVFDLTIPALSLTASNVRGDGTVVTLADGGKISAGIASMNYALLGAWNYTPASGSTSYLGQVVTGYGTAPPSVPTSGSAAYVGIGTVIGAYAVPSGANAIEGGSLNGDASVNVNFANNTVSGSLTNMKAQAAGSNTTTPWNNVSLSGTLTRGASDVTMSGPTNTTTTTGTAGFSGAAHGSFDGALYGPTAQEIAGGWNLSESTTGGGKAAFGTFGAHQ